MMSKRHGEDVASRIEAILKDAETRMQHALEHLRHDLAGYRTGRANPALLERITIDYYGVPTPINQVANISVPEPRQLLIQPWDRSTLPQIEKAIQKSDLGINPLSDGHVIRLNLPELTEERRRELIKQVHKRVEEARVAIRNVRRDVLEQLRQMEKNKQISEDDLHRFEEQVQKFTNRFIEQADKLQAAKEQELLEV